MPRRRSTTRGTSATVAGAMTSPASVPPPLRVGIVGGGLAGLSTAAHLLLAAPGDFVVEVLEAAGYLLGLYRLEDAVFVAK